MDPITVSLAALALGAGSASVVPLIVLGAVAAVIVVISLVAVTVILIHDKLQERAQRGQLAQEREALTRERERHGVELARRQAEQKDKEAKLASQSAALDQEAQELKAAKEAVALKECKAEEEKREAQEEKRKVEEKAHKVEAREALINQKLIQMAIDKIKSAKTYLDMMEEDEVPPEKIKARLKKLLPGLLLEEELRDPKTGALLNDCVKAPDGYYYNRSTLIAIYQQAQEEKKAAVCFKNPSVPLPDPATLPDDPRDPKTGALLIDCVKAPDGYYYNRSTLVAIYDQAQKEKRLPVCFKNPSIPLSDPATLPTEASQLRIKALNRVGLPEALIHAPAVMSKTPVNQNPLTEHISMSAKENPAENRSFLKGAGFCAFFILEEALDSAQSSLTAEDPVALVMESSALGAKS